MKIFNGIDLTEVKEFRSYKKSSKFLAGIFTKKEIDYSFSRADPAIHLASRFAAKEAVCKALGSFGKKLAIRDVEILKKPNGNIEAKVPQQYQFFQASSLSISHTKTFAVAFFIIVI